MKNIVGALFGLLALVSLGYGDTHEQSTAGILISEYGCELEYEYYQPQGKIVTATVVLAHGFKRNLKSQRGWAQQWLDYDIATVVVSF